PKDEQRQSRGHDGRGERAEEEGPARRGRCRRGVDDYWLSSLLMGHVVIPRFVIGQRDGEHQARQEERTAHRRVAHDAQDGWMHVAHQEAHAHRCTATWRAALGLDREACQEAGKNRLMTRRKVLETEGGLLGWTRRSSGSEAGYSVLHCSGFTR